MNNEYVVARRHAMIIRVVEPAHLTGRIIAERRPLSFARDSVLADEKMPLWPGVVCLAICALLVAGLVFWIVCGIEELFALWLS